MAELEKVISGLECCAQMAGEMCRKCPYANECENSKNLLVGASHLAADALSPLKTQEPRVITIKELEETKDPVYIELKTKGEDDKALTCFGLLSEWDDLMFHFIIDQWLLDEEPFCRFYGCELKRKEYGTEWRPWNKRPTKERMKKKKWDIQDSNGL